MRSRRPDPPDRRAVGADPSADITGERAPAGAERISTWTIIACVVTGLVVLVLVAAFLPLVSLGVWLGLTAWHLGDMWARPEGTARRRAVERGALRTTLWLPLLAPFWVGAAVLTLLSLLGDLG